MTQTRATLFDASARLSWQEGEALRIVGVLVGRPRVSLPPPLPESLRASSSAPLVPSPLLSRAAAATIATAALRLLLSGGFDERQVLRDGRRARGRILDAALNAGFELRFSAQSERLWLGVVNQVVPLAQRQAATALPREDRRAIVQLTSPQEPLAIGDMLLFALAHRHVDDLRLPRLLADLLRHQLRVASPLALLHGPDDALLSDEEVTASLRALMTPAGQRAIECLDPTLVAAWLARVNAIVMHSEDLEELVAQARALSRTLHTWLRVLDEAHRLDLARGVVQFLAMLPTHGFPQLDLRTHALLLRGVTSLAERELALQALHAIVDVRRVVEGLRHAMADQRYGDDRFDEAQLFLALVDERLAPHRGPLEALARTLTGAVG